MPCSRRGSPQRTRARDVRLVQSILYALSAPRHRTVDIVEVASKTTLPFVDVEQAFCSQREGKVHDCTVSTLDAHGHEHTFQIFFFKSERNHINTSVPSDGVWRGEILVMRKGCRRAGYVDIQPSDLARVEGMVNCFITVFGRYKASEIPANISMGDLA